jgi:hypothetical protein
LKYIPSALRTTDGKHIFFDRVEGMKVTYFEVYPQITPETQLSSIGPDPIRVLIDYTSGRKQTSYRAVILDVVEIMWRLEKEKGDEK